MSVMKYWHVFHKTRWKIDIVIGIVADQVARTSAEDLKSHVLKSKIAHTLTNICEMVFHGKNDCETGYNFRFDNSICN